MGIGWRGLSSYLSPGLESKDVALRLTRRLYGTGAKKGVERMKDMAVEGISQDAAVKVLCPRTIFSGSGMACQQEGEPFYVI